MRLALVILLMLIALRPALAVNDPVLIGTYGAWKAYSFDDAGGKVCFMSSAPIKSEGKYKKRGEVMFFITHWAAEKTANVVSFSSGYGYKSGGTAVVEIDSDRFDLATEGETAWAKAPETDAQIATALRHGKSMAVAGSSKRGTTTRDVFDLKGSSAAYKAIGKACNI
jgi:Invasion associated locus B (IalB) protein